MSISESNAAASEFYRKHDPSELALPGWDDLTPAERDEERERGEDSPYFHDFTGWCKGDCYYPQTIDETGYDSCGHPIISDREAGLA